MTLYGPLPRRFIAVRSVTLNRMMAYSESCFMCWCSQCKLFSVVHAEQTIVIVTRIVLFVNMPCSMIQRVFIAEICTRKKSSTSCHRKFRGRFPSVLFTFKWVVYGRVNRFWRTVFLLKKNKNGCDACFQKRHKMMIEHCQKHVHENVWDSFSRKPVYHSRRYMRHEIALFETTQIYKCTKTFRSQLWCESMVLSLLLLSSV
jgi:hypothetical protein